MKELLIVLWRWPNGNQFWGAHEAEDDHRALEWPKHHGLRPIAAVRVNIAEGDGAEICAGIVARMQASA